MDLKNVAQEILEGKRPADQDGGDKASPKLEPGKEQAKKGGGNAARPADQKTGEKSSDKLSDKEGKKAKGDKEEVTDDEGSFTDNKLNDMAEAKKAKKSKVETDDSEDDDEDDDDLEEAKKKMKYEADDEDKDDEDSEGDDEDDSPIESSKKKLKESAEFSLEKELGSLLESEDLDPEFKKKAITVFESAINQATKNHLEMLDEKADQYFTEAVEGYQKTLLEKQDKYLNYVVQEWVEENKLEIEQGVQVQNANSFQSAIKEVFEEHYIELPEDKEDLYQQTVQEKEDIDENLKSQIDKNITLGEEIVDLKKKLAVKNFVAESTLTDLEAEKLESLSESVEFKDNEKFNSELEVLKDNYFGGEGKSTNGDLLTEDADGDVATPKKENLDPAMKKYVSALKAV